MPGFDLSGKTPVSQQAAAPAPKTEDYICHRDKKPCSGAACPLFDGTDTDWGCVEVAAIAEQADFFNSANEAIEKYGPQLPLLAQVLATQIAQFVEKLSPKPPAEADQAPKLATKTEAGA